MTNYDVDREKLEGIDREFTLCGITFRVAPTMPAAALSDLADLQSGTARGGAYTLVTEVIRRTLRIESRDDWDALLDRDDLNVPIDLPLLLKIADDLVVTATGRPTRPPSPSMPTRSSTPRASTDHYDSEAEAVSAISNSEPA